MAIKIQGNTVISDTVELLGVSNTDNRTDQTINNSLKNQNNVLRIYDSAGTEIRTLFCAAETPQL
jgi:hypothetical protein